VQSLGLGDAPTRIDHAAVYFIAGALSGKQLQRIADELLADPVTQAASVSSRGDGPAGSATTTIEVHPLPGVTDPAAESVQLAIGAMLGVSVEVRTGNRWDMHGVDLDTAESIARRVFANPVIHAIHRGAYFPEEFRSATAHESAVRDVPLRAIEDLSLEKFSRDAHLFLSLDEMRAVRDHYRALGRDPREIELETIAQTWSEHCVHKTLKSTVHYRESSGAGAGESRHALRAEGRPNHERLADGSIVIGNLLKSTVAAATHELIADGIDWCLSVFVDNAGVIAFDETHAVCFKCETHNHPSAIEPYGGAATGIGGCIRDIMGTGLAAKPIAATDVFCVAPPDRVEVPAGCLSPQRILRQVVAGVRDYGNRMGIPTVNGAVWFDDDYVGNPLVYCGCIGVMPRDKVRGEVRAGDRIIALGGRTGRDGIHGATFSSAELTDTHADEFSHAVQIGNAITQKKALDAILALRDHADGCVFSAITDCGAGGFSSAVGEMGRLLGAVVDLERAPLKYAGLTPTEVWISEAQERMVMAVPAERLEQLAAICDAHEVEWCDLGTFGEPNRDLVLRWHGVEAGRLSTVFLEEALPTPTREATFTAPPNRAVPTTWNPPASAEALRRLLAHPNIASKRWIIRQYDHEVQGGSVVKPLMGPLQSGPSDAAVITPVAPSGSQAARGLAIANGLSTGLRDDPYLMALAAIDECVRNLVCVGADPSRIAILDNFSWPSCKDPENLGSLVRAAEGCYDGAKAFRTPFISGKDSLNNQFVTVDGSVIRIPPTLLISGFGIVESIEKCVTMDAKQAGNLLLLVGPRGGSLRGSHAGRMFDADCGDLPVLDLVRGPASARAVAALIEEGLVTSAHDVSDGGLLVAAAEMAFSGELGVRLSVEGTTGPLPVNELFTVLFNEEPSRYLLEIAPHALPRVKRMLGELPHEVLGHFTDERRLRLPQAALDEAIDALRDLWSGTLDW